MSRLILWLRNDLRMHDNYVFNWAMNYKSANKEIVPLFCFDPRYYFKDQSQTKYATRKTGLIRARFQIETVENLRKNLRNIGSDLLISCEKPEDFIPKLIVNNSNVENIIVFQSEITSEELIIEDKVQKNVEKLIKDKKEHFSAKMKPVQGLTLYHINDLEYDPNEFLPANYTKFRESNYNVQVRTLRATLKKNQLCLPQNWPEIIEKSRNFIPNLIDFGYEQEEIQQDIDKRSSYNFIGGEEKGLERLHEYIMGKKSISHYADTRNNLIGSEYSSKLSPWLANGSLSIRQVYFATKEFEEINQQNQSRKKFIDELFWRDFCKYWFIRHKNKGFSQYGFQNKAQFNWKVDKSVIERWQKGQTGMPIIDSLMREMNASGFMGNRGRQIVASYLTLDLKQDWRYGAHYFEEMLIDHDVTSNYGSWNFSAGIGPGKVLNFNSLKQSRDFDKDGNFIRMWCPELKNVPNDYIHDPWNMPIALQKSTGVILNQHYPKPISCQKYTGQEINENNLKNNHKVI